MTELLLLAAVAFAAGFCTGWSLRAALARADKQDEIVPLVNAHHPWANYELAWFDVDRLMELHEQRMGKEYFKGRGNRS